MANVNYNKAQISLDPDIEKLIAGSKVSWPRAKEEIWEDLWRRAEEIRPVAAKSKSINIQFIKYAAAAALVLLVGISSAMYFFTRSIKTSVSVQTEVILPDHSVVTLSEHSSLAYKPLLWKFSRRLRFEGEGTFEVRKGSTFSVVSKKGKTSVLGTRFILFARNNDYQVSCLSGRVKVIEFSKQNKAVINGGQKAILQPDGSFDIINIEKTDQPKNNSEKAVLQTELDELFSEGGENSDVVQGRTDEVTINKKEILSTKSSDEPSSEPVMGISNEPVKPLPENDHSQTSGQIQKSEAETNQNQAEQDKTTAENTSKQDRFRNSLSVEQIAILEDQKMSREERKKAFMESLSQDQRNLLEEQMKERARQSANSRTESRSNDELREQKTQMQEQLRQSSDKQKSKQQDMQNMDAGNETSPANKPGSDKENNGGNGKGN